MLRAFAFPQRPEQQKQAKQKWNDAGHNDDQTGDLPRLPSFITGSVGQYIQPSVEYAPHHDRAGNQDGHQVAYDGVQLFGGYCRIVGATARGEISFVLVQISVFSGRFDIGMCSL